MTARQTIAAVKTALAELDCIHDMAAEAFDSPSMCYQRCADAATRHIATLVKAGQPLPAWCLADIRHLQSLGWKFNAH